MALEDLLRRMARGRNTRTRPRRATRPKGEGRGFVDSIRALFRRG